ncbi:hypothetical protein EGD80_10780 [Bacillus subtilis]|nr:hypothetical protein EGD80_10780 [Bacillus subtilis]
MDRVTKNLEISLNYGCGKIKAVPANGYLTMRLNGLGRKAISAGWSIADYRPAYAIESYNDILHNHSDQWIITLHNPTPYRRAASFYLITKKP